MMKSLPFALSLLFALSACGHSGGGGASAVPDWAAKGFTEDMRAEAKSGTPLTAAQKATYGAWSKQSTAYLPNSSLIYDSYGQSDTEQKQKAADLAQLNDTGKAFLAKVKAKCTIVSGKPVSTGDSGVGKTETVETDSSASGKDCPVAFTSNQTEKNNWTSVDTTNDLATGKMTTDIKTSETVNDDDLKKNPIIIARTSTQHEDSNVVGLQSDDSGNITSGSIYIKSTETGTDTGSSSGLSDKNTMKWEMTASPGQKHMQALGEVDFSDGGKVIIGVFIDNDKLEVFINGESYTPERLKTDFGWDPSTLTPSPSSASKN